MYEGVSFLYTDTIDAQTREDLINQISEWRQEHKKPSLL